MQPFKRIVVCLPPYNRLLIVRIRLRVLRGQLFHSANSIRGSTCGISGAVPHCCGPNTDDWKHSDRRCRMPSILLCCEKFNESSIERFKEMVKSRPPARSLGKSVKFGGYKVEDIPHSNSTAMHGAFPPTDEEHFEELLFYSPPIY